MKRALVLLAAVLLSAARRAPAQTVAPDAAAGLSPSGAPVPPGGEAPLSIWMAASEAVPFAKTGGLADVVTSLSDELVRRGHSVSVALPRYRAMEPGADARVVDSFSVPGNQGEPVRLLQVRRGGVDFYFVDHEPMFGRADPYAYEQGQSASSRFAFFSRAVLEAARRKGESPDVLHAHDWHAALAVQLNRQDPVFRSTLLTLHNIAFQGWLSQTELETLGLESLEPQLRLNGGHSLLKGGIASADKLTTVSESYAREIQEGPKFGMGLESALRARSADLKGIVNGIDTESYNPRTDPALRARYSAWNATLGKRLNKLALQQEAGLRLDSHAPLFGFAARLVDQKGIDLVAEVLHKIADRGGQVAIAGAGQEDYAGHLRHWRERFPRAVHAPLVFSEALARKVYAASDFLLMPSRFEPCGLSQLIAMRYGSIPIVSPTGGLLDTVVESHTGLFLRDVTAASLLQAVDRALALYRSEPELRRVRANAMARDSSWGPAAAAYVKLYREALASAQPR